MQDDVEHFGGYASTNVKAMPHTTTPKVNIEKELPAIATFSYNYS